MGERFEMQQEWENQPVPMDGLRYTERKLARSSTVTRGRRLLSMGCCGCCGLRGDLEIHHIHPLCYGGLDDLSNTIALCRTCHKYAPNDPDSFYEYQRQGGQLIASLSTTTASIYGELKGEDLKEVRTIYERMMLEISAAIASRASDEIYEITKYLLNHENWGIVPLNHFLGAAFKDASQLKEHRRGNMNALALQKKVIKYMITSFHPYIPEPPAALDRKLWDNLSAIEEWHSRWTEFLDVVFRYLSEGRVSKDFYANCYNGWLGSEAMVEFLCISQEVAA
jgi:hypothetical protein